MTTKTQSATPKINSRRKGANGERELAKTLRLLFPASEIRRGQQYSGGPESPDVTGLAGLHLECKRGERLNLHKVMAKLVTESKDDETPLLCHRTNGQPWLATFQLADIRAFVHAIERNSLFGDGDYDADY